MKKLLSIFLIVVFNILAFAGEGEELLMRADAKLFPSTASYKLSVVIENDDGKINRTLFNGIKKGGAKNIMVMREPVKNAGTVQMRKENAIWVYYSTNGKTMKSAFQSITVGEAVSYGDILANDLAYDYNVTNMTESGSNVILTLNPKPKHEGYAKLIVTIDKDSAQVKKREYYALSGTLLKVCEIKETKYNEKGVLVYFKQEFFDPLKERRNFVVIEEIKELKENEVPEKYYNETQMKFFGNK